jgi:hypothetical protein
METKPKVGEHLLHNRTGPCVVDTAEIHNDNPDTIVVRFSDDVGVCQVFLKAVKLACLRCFGDGENDLGGLKTRCEACNGTGVRQ